MKRRPAFNPNQLAFTFDVSPVPRDEGALAGLSRVVSSAVARIIKEDERSRPMLAAALSEILGESIDKMTIDGWASEARDRFNISFARMLALVSVTDRVDVLDVLLREIGVAALFGEEIMTAQLGHIDRQMAQLKERRRKIEQQAVPIRRAKTGDL